MRSFLCILVAWAILWAGPALASNPPEETMVTKEPADTIGAACASESTDTAEAVLEDTTAEDGLIAWAAYWDMNGAMEELELSTRRLSTLVYFAAYFDENNALFVPDQIGLLMNYMAMLPGPLPEEYLSFTNDRLTADGGSLLKDTKILWTILSNPDQRRAHVDEIIATTQSTGLSAVEVDYEGFRNDIPLLRFFMTFVEELYAKTSAMGMPLRVVLEPSVPFDSLDFPSGPEYVMMCYNLYGTHSGPGPKADPAFLQKLVKGMETLPGKKSFAISTGGFDWTGKAKAISITYREAVALQLQYAASVKRDAESGCQYFQYRDEKGKAHDVWYADAATLRLWMDTIEAMGTYDVNIWRLGGNNPWHD